MGSGFKDWSPGDVLTAADVDGYLMRQTVMTFADASARDTALSGVLDEGMVAYLEDTNATTYYNGSSWQDLVGVWTTFTPTFGNVTLGNGTVTAEYCQVNQIVFWRLKLIFGSTTAFTGDITVNFPVPADDSILGAAGGSVNCDDQSSTDYWGALYRLNVNSAYVRVLRADLTYVGQAGINATTPFTWVAGDTLIIEDWYRPA